MRKYLNIFMLLAVLVLVFPSSGFARLEFSEINADFGVVVRPKLKTFTLNVTNRSDSPFLGAVIIKDKWLVSDISEIALKPNEPKTVIFAIDSSVMEPADYKTEITFSSYIGSGSKSIIASCIVMQGDNDPVLKIHKDKLEYNLTRGDSPVDSFKVENIGSGIIDASFSAPSWVMCEKEAKFRASFPRDFYYRITTKELIPGTYEDFFIIKSNGGNVNIPIKLVVSAAENDPILGCDKKKLDFGKVLKGRRGRAKMKILNKNKGKGSIDAFLEFPEYFIDTPTELKGIVKDREVLFVINTKQIDAGVHEGFIKIRSDYGIENIPYKIEVTEKKKKKKKQQ